MAHDDVRPSKAAKIAATRTLVALALGGCALLGRASPAAARASGIVTDNCDSCHSGGDVGQPTLTLTAQPATFNPGDLVTFTLVLRAPSIRVGGAYITTGGLGTLQTLSGEGLKVNTQGLTHSAPKAAVSGAVTFHFTWQAPTKAGGLDLGVAALAGNGNNAPSGDSPTTGHFQWVFGCEARTFYLDLDRDGYGAKSEGTLLGCITDTAPTGYSALDGDCDENDEKVHPGATELCNSKDDNCDQQIDEGSSPVIMWPDLDGDGYYKSQVGTSKTGCGNVPGYAALGGDCNDADRAIHPGATEICNLLDDNCDGVVDERVRPRCGLGWCARQSTTCNPADCHPGPPAVETCNVFDDDCDGEIDNGVCPTGFLCGQGVCKPSDGAGGAIGGSTGGSGGHLGGGGSAGNGSGHTGGDVSRGSGCVIAPSPGGTIERSRSRGELCASIFYAGCLLGSLIRRRRRG